MIAVDPGNRESGIVVMVGDEIEFSGIFENHEALLHVQRYRHHPLACEMIASYGMAVGADVFETCVWIGRLLQAHGGQHRLVKRLEVKMHLCHSSKANDATIRKALIDRYGAVGTKRSPGRLFGFSGDMWAALGVCLTAKETVGLWVGGRTSKIENTQGALL